MNKNRVINGVVNKSIYTSEWLSKNQHKIVDWVLIDKYEGDFLKPILVDGVVVEGATTEEIAEANKPIVPSIITARQLRLQLVLNGFNLNTIDFIIDSLPEPNKSIAKVSWEYATTFEREHQMLGLIAQQLGTTETELDTIFINAEKL